MKEVNGAIYELSVVGKSHTSRIKFYQVLGCQEVSVSGREVSIADYFRISKTPRKMRKVKVRVVNLVDFFNEWLKDIENNLRNNLIGDAKYFLKLFNTAKDIITFCLNNDLDIEIPEMLCEI